MADTYSILLVGLKNSEEKFVSNYFSGSGHYVITAKDADDARESLKAKRFHLVYFQAISDDNAIDELKDIAKHSDLSSLVLVCARPVDGIVLDAWHAGAADVIFNPLTSQALDTSLQRGVKQLASREFDQNPSTRGRLIYIDETGKECSVNILPPRFSIGRSSGNDLMLGQMGISRSHAEILVQNGEYLLRDLGSKQGTYLNGAHVEKSRLTHGDKIQLGGPMGVNLTFQKGDLLQSLLGNTDPKAEISLSVRGFKEVGMLFAAFRALSSVPVLDDLLALVVDTAIELTGAERGFIMLKDESGNLIFRCARNNQKSPLDGSCFKTSRRVPYDVFKTARPVVIKDLDIDGQSEDHTATRRLGLRSISCVPLRYLTVHDYGNLSGIQHAETIGVLYVDSSNVGAGLSDVRIDALETLATEAAMAIYNARLYKDSQDKRKMDEQLAIAREIQRALLPQPNRNMEYARACSQNLPCYEVGGDYFDYFNLEDGRFGFAVGDVSGKGMPAALLASLIQGILSTQALFKIPLPDMMSSVNRNLTRRGTGNRFVTFFFGVLAPDGNCNYVNAGHNPPILLSHDGSMTELTTGGMVLGLFPEAQYDSGTVKLKSNDHLVLFTDGVIEALNRDGEEFGMERLITLLRENARSNASEILNRIQEAVLAHSANTPQHDDITMMILGFGESGIRK